MTYGIWHMAYGIWHMAYLGDEGAVELLRVLFEEGGLLLGEAAAGGEKLYVRRT
jgi:hypothetical protein